MTSIYLIGSLRNPEIPHLTNSLTSLGFDVFSDWYSAGEEADDKLRDYYKGRGFNYQEILDSYAAKHIFEFDKHHLDRCDIGILMYPAGKSGHLELGYLAGQGKPTFILLDKEPERVDIMMQFTTKVCLRKLELYQELFVIIDKIKKERTGNEKL